MNDIGDLIQNFNIISVRDTEEEKNKVRNACNAKMTTKFKFETVKRYQEYMNNISEWDMMYYIRNEIEIFIDMVKKKKTLVELDVVQKRIDHDLCKFIEMYCE